MTVTYQNNSKLPTILVGFLVVLPMCFVKSVECLDCYQCKFWGGKRDGDDWGCQYNPPPSKYLRPCYTSVCLVKYAVEKGKVYTTRECSHNSYLKLGCSNITFNGEEMNSPKRAGTLCVCNDKDGCNTAESSTRSSNSNLFIVSALICLYNITSGYFYNYS